MTESVQNTQILLASRPVGRPTPANFSTVRGPIPVPGAGQALIKTMYLSLDPYMRGRMGGGPSYATPLEVGDVMLGATVGEVIETRDPAVEVGDIVLAYTGWQTYGVQDAKSLRVLDAGQAPVTTALGVLGMPGFTAYAGLTLIGRPKAGETVVVAAAAGPVGSTVGQIARIQGARTVGIAGGPEKVHYLEQIGFDAAIDHRAGDFAEQLAAATPDGIDVYYENVGGHVWDAVMPRLNLYARVPVCGLVANYNDTELPPGPDRTGQLMRLILNKSLTLRGFIQTEFNAEHFPRFLEQASEWVRDGRLQYQEDIFNGLERAPEAFIGLLEGANFGKLLVRVT